MCKVIGALQAGPLSASDLVDTTRRARAGIYKVLKGLKDDGIVLYDDDTQRYRLQSGRKLNGDEPESHRRRRGLAA